MEVFDLAEMHAFPYEERMKNVFYNKEEFKTRIIELKPGEGMPECEMDSYVIFYVVRGNVDIKVNNEVKNIGENQCIITEPTIISMESDQGVKIMGVQIKKQ